MSYRSGKDLHSLLDLPRLNQLDGANGSDRTLAVGALTRFHHLLNDLSILVFGMTSFGVPAYRQPK